jgi:hypothetical protein
MADADIVSLEGPIEEVDGKLTLRIPLDAGGNALIESSRGIATVDGAFLCVEIPAWLASKLRVVAGDLVNVNNVGGKFNITPVAARQVQ